MVELTLVGLHRDGERLTLTDANGGTYTLAVTEELRAAVRRDRPLMEQIRASQQPIRPREIQAMLRAGTTVEAVAEMSGLPLEHIQRYEGPVQAEQAWVVQQAQGFPVGRHPDSPTFGDLVINRLATRHVTADQLVWSATRAGSAPWEVSLTFPINGKRLEARWEVDLATRTLRALDDEARWLSETDASSPRARRHAVALPPQRTELRVYDVRDDGDLVELPTATDTLLDTLQSHRGTRGEVEEPDGEDLLGPPGVPGPPPGAHPALTEPEAATDARVLPLPRRSGGDEGEAQQDAPVTERKPRKPARRSVPSWDEIVFGSRPE